MRTSGPTFYLRVAKTSEIEGGPEVRVTTLLNKLLKLQGLWVKGIRFEGDAVVIEVRRRFRGLTCRQCGTRVKGRFDEKTRRWRHLALFGTTTWIEGPIRRLRCPTCEKVQKEAVPWARHRSSFTRPLEDAVGFLAQKLDHTAVSKLFGISWATVGSIAARLVAEQLHEDRFDNLRAIGVDEFGFAAHHRYLTVVSDHDRGRVIWVGEGKSAETLAAFFDELGHDRRANVEIVSIDMAAGYIKAVQDAIPRATIVFDRFHVARLAQRAVDEVRRAQMRALDPSDRGPIKRTRWALLKNPANLARTEKDKLAIVRRTNVPLYRAYLLKETFLEIFEYRSRFHARRAFHAWLAWAQRSRLAPFVRLAGTMRKHLDGILAFIDSRLTNARLEGTNNKVRLISHRAFGFHSAQPLIAMIYLCCSNITLPQLQLS
jgi:transposase